jgi:hypothetical protein
MPIPGEFGPQGLDTRTSSQTVLPGDDFLPMRMKVSLPPQRFHRAIGTTGRPTCGDSRSTTMCGIPFNSHLALNHVVVVLRGVVQIRGGRSRFCFDFRR